MKITGPQVRAARALVQWPRDHVARLSGLTVDALADFERENVDPGDEARSRLPPARPGRAAEVHPQGSPLDPQPGERRRARRG